MSHRFYFLLITVLGLIVYSNTLSVPFHFDDTEYVVENPLVRLPGSYLDPSSLKGFDLRGNIGETASNRLVAYLTFALNYRLNGLDVRGYHAVNIIVHIVNAILVYLIVSFTHSRMTVNGHKEYVALVAALVFVLHPIQTQAVTYVSQRFATLATLFYLLSFLLYARSRLSEGKRARVFMYALSLVSAVLAMKTKEIAFTLPIAVLLYEIMFLEGERKTRLLFITPMLLTLFVIPLGMAGEGPSISGAVFDAVSGHGKLSVHDYLVTEARVMLTYMRLFLFPVNQNLDYDYPAYSSVLQSGVTASLMFLLMIFTALIALARRQDKTARLAAFGGIWFFLALSVESSLVPLADVIFEHRLYLPMAGFSMFAASAYPMAARLAGEKRTMVLFVVITAMMAVLAHERNSVWRDSLSLWQDTASKSPNKVRPSNNLAVAYEENRMLDDAMRQYMHVLRLDPENAGAYNAIGAIYASEGMKRDAEWHYMKAIGLAPGFARPHYNLGVLYFESGLMELAQREFNEALRIDPGYRKARRFLMHIEKQGG